MKPQQLKLLLALSLLFNVTVLGAAVYHGWSTGQWHIGSRSSEQARFADEQLGLTEPQIKLWREKETVFKRDLASAWTQIRAHRERLIREIFSAHPDAGVIEAERTATAHLQEDQQKRVIEQLMSERDMLDDKQRDILAQLLVGQHSTGSLEEVLRLHRD